jgi:hypothetical protein
MKVCLNCSFHNDERFPICVWCDASLADVPFTPSTNPDDPEHARRALREERRLLVHRQVSFATFCYLLVITLTAAWPGLVLRPSELLLYSASSLIVALAIQRDIAGQLSAALLQGGFSLLLVICFESMQPFVFFMFAAHIVAPMVFWHWAEMIHDAHR